LITINKHAMLTDVSTPHVNADIATNAAIAESKLSFDPTVGHKHDGILARQTLHSDLGGITPTDHHTKPDANEILAKLQRHQGIWWFNNHWRPSGMLYSSALGSGSISWYVDRIVLYSGTTSGSYVSVRKDTRGLSWGFSWDKKRYFGVLVHFVTYSAQYIHIVNGGLSVDSATNPYLHIGFKLINGDLYGTVGNGSYESTLSIETLTAGGRRRLECVLDPAIPECRFYVDGVDKGAITTNLPTGTGAAERVFVASTYNTEAANKYYIIYVSRTFQEE